MARFKSADDAGFIAVAGELRRFSEQFVQSEAPGSLGENEHLDRKGKRPDREGSSKGSGNIVNQSGSWVVHGNVNINQSV